MQPGMTAKPRRLFTLADRKDGIVLLFRSQSSYQDPLTIHNQLKMCPTTPKITIILCVRARARVSFQIFGTPTNTPLITHNGKLQKRLVHENNQPDSAG